MTTHATPRTLLVPRLRPGRPADFATREAVVARQGHRARRLRRVRRAARILGRVLVLGLGVATMGFAGQAITHWLRTTPLLGVTGVEVVGTQRLDAAEVLAAARIEPGTNLLALDTAAVRERIETLPGVRHARVVRHLPGRVVLSVAEREPYALVNGRAGLAWIDARGHLVGRERRASAPALPILSGVEPATGRDDAPLGDRLHAGLTLLRAVERTGGRLAGRISEIDLVGVEGPVLYTVDGVSVRVGGEAWAERLARLDGVLAELDARGERVAAVDLRYRDLVVLKPRVTTEGDEAEPAGPGRSASTPNSLERH